MKKHKLAITITLCCCSFIFGTGGANAQTTLENLEVAKTDSIVLSAGTTVNNLVINADKFKCGQLLIESGVVKVNNLTYKFTINPTEWTLISFPTDIVNINLPTSSNLAALGITQNTGVKRYNFKRYDSEARSNNIEPWILTTTPDLKGNRGYLMYIYTGSTTPVEVEFYFSNLTLDKNKTINQVLIDVDMAGKIAQSDYQMVVKPSNVKGNTLNVTVHNAPDGASQPINYQEAVEAAKVYFTEDNDAIRISLPTAENCKVLIMDKRMKKVIKAIDYVSPGAIPVTDLKRGKYSLYMEYNKASGVKEFEKK